MRATGPRRDPWYVTKRSAVHPRSPPACWVRRLHHLGIGRRHADKPVLILVKDLNVRITTTKGELLRDFTLNPHRDYQPQPKT